MIRSTAVLLACLSMPCAAQSLPDRGSVAVGGVLPSSPFGDPWSPEPGLAARLALPLHGGTGDAALRVLPFTSADLSTPEFVLVTATVGWGPALRLGPASLTPTARLGSALFLFEPDDDNPELAVNVNEFEVAVGGALRGELALGRVVLWTEGEALRLALRDPLTMPSLSAGLGVRFGVPPAVRRLLDE